MKILHTSDWHLGRVLHDRSLLPDQRHFLGQLLDLLRTDEHQALVVAGDVFDRSIPPEDAVDVLSGFLRDLRAACPALTVIVIAGNHDSGSRLAYGAPILASAGVHVRGGVELLEQPVRVRAKGGEEAEVWPVPFLWPGQLTDHLRVPAPAAGLKAASAAAPVGRPPSEPGAPPLASQAGALAEALRRVRERRDPRSGRAQILVSHCLAAGGQVSESERPLLGAAHQVSAGLFAGFDYVALGHLHRPQPVSLRAWYSGSPIKYSFSEAGDEKVVLSVEVEAGAAPQVTPHRLRPLRDMVILRDRFEALCTDPRYQRYQDCYLRAELTVDEPVSQPVAVLRRRFPWLLDFRVADERAAGARGPLAEPCAGPGARTEGLDLEADFLDFERVLHGEGPLDPRLLERFRELLERALRLDPLEPQEASPAPDPPASTPPASGAPAAAPSLPGPPPDDGEAAA